MYSTIIAGPNAKAGIRGDVSNAEVYNTFSYRSYVNGRMHNIGHRTKQPSTHLPSLCKNADHRVLTSDCQPITLYQDTLSQNFTRSNGCPANAGTTPALAGTTQELETTSLAVAETTSAMAKTTQVLAGLSLGTVATMVTLSAVAVLGIVYSSYHWIKGYQ